MFFFLGQNFVEADNCIGATGATIGKMWRVKTAKS